MLTVADLANEIHCTVSDIQRAARELGVPAKSPGFKLSLEDYRSLRERVEEHKEQERLRASEQVEPTRVAPRTILGDRYVGVRDLVGRVRGATTVQLRLHEDFVHWLWSSSTDAKLKRRANLVLRQLAAFGRTSIVKSVAGAGRGWRRSPLGGNQGRQFYLWWVPTGAPPIAHLEVAKDTVLVRAVRHHDETSSALSPGAVPGDYIDLSPDDLVNQTVDYGFAFSTAQQAITRSTSAVRFIKGHPGAGKTTALWLAASVAEGRQALYLTFSSKLALDAEQYFKALGPEQLSIQVLTFDQLTNRILDASDAKALSSLGAEEAVEEFNEVIAGNYRGVLGPWDQRLDELYAELHAHAVGEALPLPLRDVPASPGAVIERSEYVKLRSGILGTQAARTASQIAEHLARGGLVEQLFPGPARARRALDRLLAEPTVVEPLGAVDVVLVDEVQDLTRVELMLLVKLCATIGERRDAGPPAFIAAGDEAQTVRPSDFEWGQLADLTASLIGRRSEFELPGNVRSPRNIAVVVNESWELYRHFAKDERPRGSAEAEVDDAAPGRVVYTVCKSEDELREIFEAFEAIPNAALVYPGYRVPESLSGVAATTDAILTSHSAKGLDFQTVAVLDVGRRLTRLRELAHEAETEGRFAALWGRTLADHVRVALSRATETLVLLDTGSGKSWREEVLALCGDAHLVELEPEDLVTFLRRDDSDAAELALEFCDEVEKVLGTQPLRAYRRAKQAVGLLGDPRLEDSVQDAALRRQAWILRGVAAVDLLRNYKQTRPRPNQTVDELAADAVTSLRRGERGQDAQAVQLVQALSTGLGAPGSVLREATELLALLPLLERYIERFARDVLISWCREMVGAPVPLGSTAQTELLDTVQNLTSQMSEQHPELGQQRNKLLHNIASAAASEGRYADALSLVKRLPVRDHAIEALCNERLGNHALAAQAYELARDPSGALRNLRQVPDVPGALRLAQLLNHEDLPALQWLSRYCDVMASLDPHVAARLTDAERRVVSAVRDDALLDSSHGPTSEPPVLD